jgi:hypothetical protein
MTECSDLYIAGAGIRPSSAVCFILCALVELTLTPICRCQSASIWAHRQRSTSMTLCTLACAARGHPRRRYVMQPVFVCHESREV